MNKITKGTKIPSISLPSIDNTNFNTEQLFGKPYLLSFHRFASCPFCNLRIHELASRYHELDTNFEIVLVFSSPLGSLQKHARQHTAGFPILADEADIYYKKFSVQRSLWRALKGGVLRLPTVLHALFVKGYWPTTLKGFTIMPLSILVDEHGYVQATYYGKDEGDHMSFKDILNFSHNHDSHNQG